MFCYTFKSYFAVTFVIKKTNLIEVSLKVVCRLHNLQNLFVESGPSKTETKNRMNRVGTTVNVTNYVIMTSDLTAPQRSSCLISTYQACIKFMLLFWMRCPSHTRNTQSFKTRTNVPAPLFILLMQISKKKKTSM